MLNPSCSVDPANNTLTSPKKKVSGSRDEKKELVNSGEMWCSARRRFSRAFHAIDDISNEYISQSDFRIRDSLLVGLVEE